MQVGFSESSIMSSCVMPRIRGDATPVVLLHCFDRFVICNQIVVMSFDMICFRCCLMTCCIF